MDYNWDDDPPTTHLQTFEYVNAPRPNLVTHFEGITRYGLSCYSLAATGDEKDPANRGAAYAVVKRHPDGSFFPEADWQRVEYLVNGVPGSGTTTGNTVVANNLYGIYIPPGNPPSGPIQSYVALSLPAPVKFTCS